MGKSPLIAPYHKLAVEKSGQEPFLVSLAALAGILVPPPPSPPQRAPAA